MSKPKLTYDAATNTFFDADGHVLVTFPLPGGSAPAPTNDLTQTIAAAFGYTAEDAPDILRIESVGTSEEDTPSQAHRDIAAAFTRETEPGV